MSDQEVQSHDVPLRISVVCPVYNSRAYVQRTIDALYGQSILPDELIVIDDGSSDGTPEFLQAYVDSLHKPVKFMLLKMEHRGPGAARNAGIANATGNWIAFLDSDDIWFPEKISSLINCLKQNPNVNFVCHHEEYVRMDGSRSVLSYASRYSSKRPLTEQLYQVNLFSTSAVACRRELLMEHGKFDATLMSAQDYELWLRLSPHIRLLFIESVLGQYVERPGNITSGRVGRRMLNELRIAWQHRQFTTWRGLPVRILRILMSYTKQYLRNRIKYLFERK